MLPAESSGLSVSSVESAVKLLFSEDRGFRALHGCVVQAMTLWVNRIERTLRTTAQAVARLP